jgi:uncharacterized protein (TIGR02246 family)
MLETRKTYVRGWAAMALLLTSAAAACEQTPTVHAAQDAPLTAPGSTGAAMAIVPPAAEREIRAHLAAWTAAWASMDGTAYGSMYAEDADFVNPLGGILSGRAAIAATHTFLFNPVNGPFRGSIQTYEIRRLVALRGDLALVDLNVALTGYAGLPPGLGETEPGVVRTRARLLMGRNGAHWEILAQQYTGIAP